jgi:hypothetical protein
MDIVLPPGCDPRLRRFAEYLAAKAAPGKLLGRQHIDPAEIPDLLPWLVLYDVVPQESGGPRYRVRLAGTRVVEILGDETTRKYLDEMLPTVGGLEIIRQYDQIVATRQPHYFEGNLRNRGREHILFQRIAFPLAHDGETVDMLVMIMVGFDTHASQYGKEIPKAGQPRTYRPRWPLLSRQWALASRGV